MIAYMLTWTTYGSWLQGDNRGYVKDGKILSPNYELQISNANLQKKDIVNFGDNHKKIVKNAIVDEAERIDQIIHAITVQSNHVHIVLDKTNESIENAVVRYKNKSTRALRADGFIGKVWTRKYDKRFLFEPNHLKSAIEYVQTHPTPV